MENIFDFNEWKKKLEKRKKDKQPEGRVFEESVGDNLFFNDPDGPNKK